MAKKKQKKYLFFIALVLVAAVVISGVFILALKAASSGKVVLEHEYYGVSGETVLDKDEYEQMLKQQKSFIVASAASACSSDILDFIDDFSENEKIAYFYLNWSNFHESSTGEEIKYPPTVFIVEKGKIRAYLDSDADKDVEKYNNYEDFVAWMRENIEF